ncbi:hypothetical protein PanWU01x14_022940, partial [Parasponia andersonii]
AFSSPTSHLFSHSTSPRLLALDLSHSCSPLAAASQGYKLRTFSPVFYCLASLSNSANGVSPQHFLTIVGSLFNRPTVEQFPLIPSLSFLVCYVEIMSLSLSLRGFFLKKKKKFEFEFKIIC